MPTRFRLFKSPGTSLVVSLVMVPVCLPTKYFWKHKIVLLILGFEHRTLRENIKTWFLYLGQPATTGLYSLPRDSLIPGVVPGALIPRLEVIPRMVLSDSPSRRSLPHLRLDRPPVQAECISWCLVAALCVQWTCPTTLKYAQVALLGRQNNLIVCDPALIVRPIAPWDVFLVRPYF